MVAAFNVVSLTAATATQKAAFKAEKKATVIATAAAKKAAAAVNKASVLEGKAIAAFSALSPASKYLVNTPEEFIVARTMYAAGKADEHWFAFIQDDATMTQRVAAWNYGDKAFVASEKTFYNSLSSVEKAAYKASLAAAIAIEEAGAAIDEAATAAEYANMSIAHRIEYNDARAADEDALVAQAAVLSRAKLKVAKVYHSAMLRAEMGDFLVYFAGLSPSERQIEFAAATALNPDPVTADDIVIADGARFE